MAVLDGASSEDDEKALYLAKCVQRSSVVSHAVCGHIRSPLTVDVVFGKETALELVVVAEDGSVQSVCEQSVFGSIKDMKLLVWNESHRAPDLQTYGKDLLVLLSDSGKLSFLTFNLEFHRFLAVSQVHLAQPGVSLRELGWLLAVESTSRAVAVAAFEDHLAIFPTSVTAGTNVVDKGINYVLEAGTSLETSPMLDSTSGCTIWSMSFVTEPVLTGTVFLVVLLNRRGDPRNEVQVLLCDPNERAIQLSARYTPPGEQISYSLSEVPASPGLFLLFRTGHVMLLEIKATSSSYVSDIAASVLLDFSVGATGHREGRPGDVEQLPSVTTWCWEPDSGRVRRLVFSLDSGDIYTSTLYIVHGEPAQALTASQYRCSPCKVLLWTRGGFITAMVEMGDGYVLKVENDRLTFQSSIQNIAPILDFSLADYYGDKQDQMFACCGGGQEGSIRIIRNGNSVEKLFCTAPIYQGVSAVWTVRLRFNDPHHAFFLISFVEETRVLSVGVSFVDVTDAVGFDPRKNTLACGLVEDGWLAQVSSSEVRLCCPTKAAHPTGVDCPSPLFSSWKQHGCCISVGAVSHGRVIVALAKPALHLLMLGTVRNTTGLMELVELQFCRLEAEISCISFPQCISAVPVPPTILGLQRGDAVPKGVDLRNVCVVGTHKPSVELLCIAPGVNFEPLAVGMISLGASAKSPPSGSVPQDVQLALFDRLYILTGLRNGMLLRYEWPENNNQSLRDAGRPADLRLIAVRRLGVSPVSLVPLEASLRSDIIVLSDRPWLLQTANSQRISYASISFQPSTHVTPVSSQHCPRGLIFLSDCSLHLVEMDQSRTLNVQKIHLGSTARRILYHTNSKTLIALGTDPQGGSELLCTDPLDGTLHCRFSLAAGEVAKCLQFMRYMNSQLLLVGTSSGSSRPSLATGEAESSLKGHLLLIRLEPKSKRASSPSSPSCSAANEDDNVFSESEEWELVSKGGIFLSGPVLALAPYLGHYVIASAGNTLFCLGFSNEGSIRLKKLTSIKTRFVITNIAVHFTTIAVGDCRDGLLLYTFREDARKLEQLQCDPMRRIIADCALVDVDTAVVMDRLGNFCALSSTEGAEENGSPERNLNADCWFHLGEISMSIRKGSFAYKASVRDTNSVDRLMHNMANSCIVASTLLGSVFIFIRVTRDEYKLLREVQERLAIYPLTAPVLGNDHARFRGQGCPASVNKALDGDMLSQFLELPNVEQLAALKPAWIVEPLPIEQVLRLLERIHHTLT